MPKNTEQFQDIVIHISEQKNNSHSIRLRESPWGEAQVSLDNVAFEKLKRRNSILEDTYEKFLEIRGDPKAIRILSKRFGKELFDAIFRDDIRRKLDKSFGAAYAENITLRILLQIESKIFSDLNLELLYDNGMPHRGDAFLSRGRKTILARYPIKQAPDNSLLQTRKLKILVVISSPKDMSTLASKTEKDSLTKALRKKSELSMRFLRLSPAIEVNYLENATYTKLESKIDRYQPQIIHFVGHAGYKDNEPSLVLETEEQLSDYVFGERAWRLFRNEKSSIQFVFLNACQSFHLCQELVSQFGISMVIGTRYPVYDRVAIDFTAKLYACILDRFSVDHAVREAREITLRVDEFQWMAYVLAMHKKDGKFFEFSLAPELSKILEQVWLYIADLGSEIKETYDAALQGLVNLGKSVVGLLLMVVETTQMQIKQRNGATEALGEIMDATGDTLPIEPLSNIIKKTDEPIPLRHEALKALFKSDTDESREQITSIWFDPRLNEVIKYGDLAQNHTGKSSEIIWLLSDLESLNHDIGQLREETNQLSQKYAHYLSEKEQSFLIIDELDQKYNRWIQDLHKLSSQLEKRFTKAIAITAIIQNNKHLLEDIDEAEQYLYTQVSTVLHSRLTNIEHNQKLKLILQNLKMKLDTLQQATPNTWEKAFRNSHYAAQKKIDDIAMQLSLFSFEFPLENLIPAINQTSNKLNGLIKQLAIIAILHQTMSNDFLTGMENHRTKGNTWANYVNQGYMMAEKGYTNMTNQKLGKLVKNANRLAEDLNLESNQLNQQAEILMEILSWGPSHKRTLETRSQILGELLVDLESSYKYNSDSDRKLDSENLLQTANRNLNSFENEIHQINFIDIRTVVAEILREMKPITDAASEKVNWIRGKTVTTLDGRFTFKENTWWRHS
ncbi:CHAT domain-containing protein [Candidatus Leptofilum sp.]|uniref:CHAT domain-containing protein n=1 Tax=Candidatus Leptofilum sp. TaxID=3241576 RepID=UPI003B59BA96